MSSPAQTLPHPLTRPWSLPFSCRRLLAALAAARCRCLHREISRPVHGRYRCWVCLREFDAGW